jgi:hypothetical protein
MKNAAYGKNHRQHSFFGKYARLQSWGGPAQNEHLSYHSASGRQYGDKQWVHNSWCSQIVKALGKLFAADIFKSYPSGTETKPQVNPDAVRLIRQLYGMPSPASAVRNWVGRTQRPGRYRVFKNNRYYKSKVLISLNAYKAEPYKLSVL